MKTSDAMFTKNIRDFASDWASKYDFNTYNVDMAKNNTELEILL